jgi:putative FmdB family regulatory protein
MPIITFKCGNCDTVFDKLVRGFAKLGHDFHKPCPKCGKDSIQILAVPSPAQWKCERSTL